MISAFAGYQQSSNISLLQGASENGSQQKTPPPGPRNMLGAVQQHTNGTRQAFDDAASQILTSFLDSLQNKISDDPNKGANNAGSLTSLTSAEFESSLSISSEKWDSSGAASFFELEAYSGLSFEMEEVDGQLVGFSLDFEMETSFSFEGANANGGYQALDYSNVQSFSISYSLEEDENGNVISELSFERSEEISASYLSYGDQTGLGFGANSGSLEDIARFMDGNGSQAQFGATPSGEPPLTAEALVDLEMQAALEIMKSITEDLYKDTVTSLFSDTYYNDY